MNDISLGEVNNDDESLIHELDDKYKSLWVKDDFENTVESEIDLENMVDGDEDLEENLNDVIVDDQQKSQEFKKKQHKQSHINKRTVRKRRHSELELIDEEESFHCDECTNTDPHSH